MNANELADKLEMGCHDWANDAATMLRQQQAEIEALRIRLQMEFEYAEKLLKAQQK